MASCYPGHSLTFGIKERCQHDLDDNHNLKVSGNRVHLEICKKYICTNSFKCPQLYCIPYRRLCDGYNDCIHGDDEKGCDNYACVGMLKCSDAPYCVHPIEMCDGVRNCQAGDDEVVCVHPCTLYCTCLAYANQCNNHKLTSIPIANLNILYLYVKRNILSSSNITYMPNLEHLIISHSNIQVVCSLFPFTLFIFYNLPKS